MDELQNPRSGTIESLPIELVCMILSVIPDVESLQAVVLSCPLFYSAFQAAEASVTAHVLFNQIDASVLPEAMAAIDSSWLRSPTEKCHDQDRDAMMNFVARNFRQRPTPPDTWLLKRALPLGRLHSCVEELAKQFAEATVSRGPAARCPLSTTYRERCRIERALYRFEIYCNLFCEVDTEPYIYRNQVELFFTNFSPWENEQLGCVHDFLVRAVSPAFNEVVEHDISWAVAHVNYAQYIDAPCIQYILSLGLKKLYEIMRTKTYEDREPILCSGGLPPRMKSFLYEGFRCLNRATDDFSLHSPDAVDDMDPRMQPFYHDQDSGPAGVWRWAHHGESGRSWVYQPNRHNLCKWGYVMWNRLRLDAIGIFHNAWEETDEDNSELLLDEEETRYRQIYLYYSQEQRKDVARRGGSGWWSWGDDSKVRWRPEGRHSRIVVDDPSPVPGPLLPTHLQPKSLQEARESLNRMKTLLGGSPRWFIIR